MVQRPPYWDDNISHSGWPLQKMFESIPFGKFTKADVSDELRGPREEEDADKVASKIRAMVDALIVAAPSLDRQTATHFLLHSAKGQALARHLNEISKGETIMPQVDIMKLQNPASVVEIAKNIIDGKTDMDGFTYDQILLGHAKLNKRAGESTGGALERILTDADHPEIRKAYA